MSNFEIVQKIAKASGLPGRGVPGVWQLTAPVGELTLPAEAARSVRLLARDFDGDHGFGPAIWFDCPPIVDGTTVTMKVSAPLCSRKAAKAFTLALRVSANIPYISGEDLLNTALFLLKTRIINRR